MSEGGIFPWKVQKIELPKYGRTGTYAGLSKPLPDPPQGQAWVQDVSSREWKLVPVVLASAHVVAVARVADDADVVTSENSALTTAVSVAVDAVTLVDRNRGAAPPAGIRHHEVIPTDTFQGICLRYRVTPTELRRANKMMGSDLKLAPEILVIPSNEKNQQLDARRCSTKEEKIATLVFKVSRITKDKLSYSEALAYLEMADGDVNGAIENVYEDYGWSLEQEKIATLIAKVSRITREKLIHSEVRAYLEMADWDVNSALESINKDFGTTWA